ncbi:MAG: TonB-dependent receptor [Opitutaceae bacterium]|jgi:iron complex outermembrane receptor protein
MKLPVLLISMAIASVSILRAETPPGPVVAVEPMVVRGEAMRHAPFERSFESLSGSTQDECRLPGITARFGNLSLSTSGWSSFNATLGLRGMTNTPIFGDPAVSVYLDDIPLGSTFALPGDLPGLGSVELRRGAGQNTLAGRAGPAGILVLSTPATPNGGEIRASFGSDGYRGGDVTASAAGAGADVFAAASYRHQDGFLYDSTLGRKVDGREALSGLARVRIKTDGPVQWTLLANAWRERDGEQPLVPLGGPMFEVSRSEIGETQVEALNAGVTASVEAPWGRASATTSANDWKLGPYRSVLSFGPALLLNDATTRQRAINEEIRFASSGHEALRWQGGLFFSDGSTEGSFARAIGPMVLEQSFYNIDATQLAAFGQAERDLGGGFSLGAGLRVETVRKTLDRHEAAPQPGVYALSQTSSAILPKLTLSYETASHGRLFASLGAGFKPGGFSAFTGNRALAAFGPERNAGGEAGYHFETSGGALAATLRGFMYQITGYQIERSFATNAQSDDYLVVNAPKARTAGAEIETAWHPAEGWTVAAAAGFTKAELRRFTDPYTGISYSGKQPPYIAPVNESLRVEYKNPSGWFASAGLSATGRTYYTESEDLHFGQKAFALLGARTGYDAGKWRIVLWGENLADARYYSLISAGTAHGSPGSPRTWGIEGALRF